jgi:hypothetical protein
MKSSKLHISERRRVFARFLGKIQHAILEALAEEHEERGLTRAEIARILSTNKGSITNKLSGTRNMTIESIADFAFAMGRPDIQISFPARTKGAASNHRSAVQASTSATPLPTVKVTAGTSPASSVEEVFSYAG